MKRVVISILALLLLALPLAIETRAQGHKNSAAHATQRRAVPPGIVIKRDRAIAKPGYVFEKTSDHTFLVRRTNSTQGFGVSLTCTCAAGKSGACLAEISSTVATCSGDCSCSFHIVFIDRKAKTQ
jgi:hypothetical protein